MRYYFGRYSFRLLAGGAVEMYDAVADREQEFYPGDVVTYKELVIWAQGFVAGRGEPQ